MVRRLARVRFGGHFARGDKKKHRGDDCGHTGFQLENVFFETKGRVVRVCEWVAEWGVFYLRAEVVRGAAFQERPTIFAPLLKARILEYRSSVRLPRLCETSRAPSSGKIFPRRESSSAEKISGSGFEVEIFGTGGAIGIAFTTIGKMALAIGKSRRGIPDATGRINRRKKKRAS